jgi:hypothetical protein
MEEIARVTAPGGYIHLVTPFCHPFHGYPKDYRRFTIDGLKELAGPLELVAQGWHTGPTVVAACPEAGRIGNHCYVWLRKPS